MDQAVSRGRRWPLGGWRRRLASDDERLSAAIADFTIQKRYRGSPGAPWARRADAYLAEARRDRDRGRVNAAWSSLKAANRELLDTFSTVELLVEADRLGREAKDKLTGWRLDAITTALDLAWKRLGDEAKLRAAVTAALDVPEGGTEVSPYEGLRQRLTLALAERSRPATSTAERDELRVRVKDAKRVLDEHHDNVYKKIDILRRHLLLAGVVLFMFLVFTLVAAALGTAATSGSTLLSNPLSVAVVMILGALGAAVSGVLTPLNRDPYQRIPDASVQSYLAWLRPIVGAGAAVIVVSILRSGIAGVSVDQQLVPVAAIAAGFSERVVGQSVAMASTALGK